MTLFPKILAKNQVNTKEKRMYKECGKRFLIKKINYECENGK